MVGCDRLYYNRIEIPQGALYMRGNRLEYRPSIWICRDDERRCCGGTPCASLKQNKTMLCCFLLSSVTAKRPTSSSAIPPSLQSSCTIRWLPGHSASTILYILIYFKGLDYWMQTKLSHYKFTYKRSSVLF